MHELDERSDSFELMPVPTEFADMAITRKQMEATTSFDETTSESNEGLNEDDEYELNDPNLNESSRRKVRHNLTERRRVDRMNQVRAARPSSHRPCCMCLLPALTSACCLLALPR